MVDATIRGLTVDNATAADDRILITSAALGSGTRFDGTITNANLTAARTYTLQDNSGIIPLATATLPDAQLVVPSLYHCYLSNVIY
jgi:hypothetical protein